MCTGDTVQSRMQLARQMEGLKPIDRHLAIRMTVHTEQMGVFHQMYQNTLFIKRVEFGRHFHSI